MGALMLQGTGSDVGKSVLVAGLARAFTNRSLVVRPFKPQNMSNNAAVTVDGGEIGSAQALQALACHASPHSDMNPVLLKPDADHSSQLIVQGKPFGQMGGQNFRTERAALLPKVLESYHRLEAEADLVLVEGAGSPAEINLRAGDIANMGFARAAQVPTILVGDINRGGVIAAIAGTRTVLDTEDAAMIRGFIINKFRGDPSLFTDGYRQTEEFSGWRGFGVVPWIGAAARLPSEDTAIFSKQTTISGGQLKIACPILPRIAGFDALDPLDAESRVQLVMVRPGEVIPEDAGLIILPDSKSVMADLAFIRAEGWDIDIRAHHRRGRSVIGLGAGFHMLGRSIAGPAGEAEGLGLLDLETMHNLDTGLTSVAGTAFGARFHGDMRVTGQTSGPDCARPFAILSKARPEGAVSADGLVFGTHFTSLWDNTELRANFLQHLGIASDKADHQAMVDQTLDNIADVLEKHLDVDGLLKLALEGA